MAFNNCFVVHGIRIVEKKDGDVFVSIPQVKTEDGYNGICHSINTEFRNYLCNEIIKVYNEKLIIN